MGLLQDSAAARCWHLSLLSAHSHSSPWLWQEIPVGAPADMGRQEADYVWKKTTENIQDVFEFMEELGSWVHFCSCVFLSQVLLHVYDDKSESFINYRQSHVNGDVREVKNRQTCDLFTEGIVNEMTKYLRNGNSVCICLLVLQQIFCFSRSLSHSGQFVSAPCSRGSITDPEHAAALAGQITALIGLTRGGRLYGGLRQQDALAVRGIVRLSWWRLAEVSSVAHSQKTTTTTKIDFFSVPFSVIVFFREETKRENLIRVHTFLLERGDSQTMLKEEDKRRAAAFWIHFIPQNKTF